MFQKNQSRAARRRDVARLKKARAGYWGSEGKGLEGRDLGAVVQHPCICSCWMCGNPRKLSGERTVQERRQLEALAELQAHFE